MTANQNLVLEESTATKEMVRHNIGIACLPRCTVAAELASRTLIELKTTEHLPDLELRCGYIGHLLQAREISCTASSAENSIEPLAIRLDRNLLAFASRKDSCRVARF